MWLINVETRLLENFFGAPESIPAYAILSHTWEDRQEVTFQDMWPAPAPDERRGWDKIDMTCLQAARDGLHYAWVDTCCIDKSSSAELTEAINSMFNWYKRSAQCYAYLSDLTTVPPLDAWATSVEHCRWFTRGWTLQELIAPSEVKFYNREWEPCSKRSDVSTQLAETTKISLGILNHTEELSTVSVAQKMSWAARRQTTRIEDTAYCLMGIFDINMPLLYGEEGKAFTRLQAEIIQSCPDPSIFAWVQAPDDETTDTPEAFSGVLAPSPKCFKGAGEMTKVTGRFIPDFSMSNRGIKVHGKFNLRIAYKTKDDKILALALPVCQHGDETLGIYVRNIGHGSFVRQNPARLIKVYISEGGVTLVLSPYLLTQMPASSSMHPRDCILKPRHHAMKIELGADMSIYRRWPWQKWDDVDSIFFGSDETEMNWAVVKIVAVPPEFYAKSRDPIIFLFYAIGWSKLPGCKLRSGVHKVTGSLPDRQLEDTNDRAVAESWDGHWVLNRLVMNNIPQHSHIATHSSGGRTLLLKYSVKMVENGDLCLNPFWQAKFWWEIVPDTKVPKIINTRWQ